MQDSRTQQIKERIENAPLSDACRLIVHELREGLASAQTAIDLLKWELRPDTERFLTDEQRQEFLDNASTGLQNVFTRVDELLAGHLMRRLQQLDAETNKQQ
jgi:signal transduction histidine kinase